jgi:hypothetical protein
MLTFACTLWKLGRVTVLIQSHPADQNAYIVTTSGIFWVCVSNLGIVQSTCAHTMALCLHVHHSHTHIIQGYTLRTVHTIWGDSAAHPKTSIDYAIMRTAIFYYLLCSWDALHASELDVSSLSSVKADSHIPCRSHAVLKADSHIRCRSPATILPFSDSAVLRESPLSCTWSSPAISFQELSFTKLLS